MNNSTDICQKCNLTVKEISEFMLRCHVNPPWGVFGGLMVPFILVVIVIIMLRESIVDQVRRPRPQRTMEAGESRKFPDRECREIRKVAPVPLIAEDENPSQSGCDQEVVSDDFVVITEPVMDDSQARLIEVSNLLDYVCRRLKEDHPFQDEFKELPIGLIHPHEEAHKPENSVRSRYKGIVPYDHSRVVLRSEDSENETDFINASYIDGEYIAAQGPMKDTIGEFWRMVWQEKSCRIVMLTNLHEWGVKKVEQYWPDVGEVQYGNLTIRMENIKHLSSAIVRKIRVVKGEESREVLHFLFPHWPDHDVPRETSGILHFWFQLYSISRHVSGPIVVHCSAGVGRTGTFISLDRLLTRSKRDRYLNVFACVQQLRNRRTQMVQTLNQYVFLHRALLDGVMCEGSIMEDKEFVGVCDRISRSSHDYENLDRVNQQYEKLEALRRLNDEQICKEASESENVSKNRYSDCLPDWRYQVYLSPVNGVNGYINAVMFPGYDNGRTFIATQMPLSNTIHDFWRMVEEQDCSTIVTLEPIDDFEIYWPEMKESIDMGSFDVIQTDKRVLDIVVQRTFSLVYKTVANDYRMVKQFCFRKWPYEDSVPSTYIDLLLLMESVSEWTGRPSLSTILLQCRNGAERCGLYCICWTALERLRKENIVSLMLSVKELRRIRSKVINSVAQYRFCENFVLQYLKGFHDYSNFQFTPSKTIEL